MAGKEMAEHRHMGHGMSPSEMLFMDESSGTAVQPSAWPMPMVMTASGGWNLMWMGQAFLVETQQAEPRGGDKLYSVNWGMLSGIHPMGKGSLLLRAMVSLDPATASAS